MAPCRTTVHALYVYEHTYMGSGQIALRHVLYLFDLVTIFQSILDAADPPQILLPNKKQERWKKTENPASPYPRALY
jgi:hypothetical protein